MIPFVVGEAARRFGDTPAFVDVNQSVLTYAELHRVSDEVAVGLSRRGVRAGDVVVLQLPSTPAYVLAYLALAKIGAITAGINPSLAPPEQARLVELAGAAAVLTSADEIAGLRVAGASPPALPDDRGRDVAIVFTSGTTGVPKGAVFTNRQLEAITQIDVGDAWGGGGAMLASTQFAHIGFMTKLPWYLRLGTTTHLLERWRADDVLALVADQRIASVGGISAQIALLLAVADFDTYDLSAVKTIIVGGGPSSPGLVNEARERFGAAYSIRYSSTESGGCGTGTAFDAPDEEALWTVGRPRGSIEVEIRDEDGAPVGDGEIGEVCLRSPAVMDRYWNDPEATASTLRDGWLHSGDLGFIDEAGCLRLAGRKKEMFIRGGYNVFPMEVESVLSSHPQVASVAVVPRPDPKMGEIGVAVVVPRSGATAPTLDELRSHAEGQLAKWKLPEAIRVVDALPLTAMQKVDRAALAAAEIANA